MDKAILVIDMPKNCFDCPLCINDEYGLSLKCCLRYKEYVDKDGKPDWCPLKPAPEKIDIPDFNNTVKAKSENAYEVGMYMHERGMYLGHNICIDKILGE